MVTIPLSKEYFPVFVCCAIWHHQCFGKIPGNFPSFPISFCLQCFDAVGWAAGRASGLEKNEW